MPKKPIQMPEKMRCREKCHHPLHKKDDELTMGEEEKNEKESTGTFRFRRYREEVARRRMNKTSFSEQQLQQQHNGMTTTNNNNNTNTNNNMHNKQRYNATTDRVTNDGTVLQDLSDVRITIDRTGNVTMDDVINSATTTSTTAVGIEKNTEKLYDDTDDSIHNRKNRKPVSSISVGTTLLLRNLRDCIITIDFLFPAIHFTGIVNTTICYNNNDSNNHNDSKLSSSDAGNNGDTMMTATTTTEVAQKTTIHMTDCRGRSSLRLQIPAHQLRIHYSIGLRIEMMITKKTTMKKNSSLVVTPTPTWKPGTIILEKSKDVTFFVPIMLLHENDKNNFGGVFITEQQQQQLVSQNTKSYWYQVIVKDFQWLRKGIPSPNFQVEVGIDNDCSGGGGLCNYSSGGEKIERGIEKICSFDNPRDNIGKDENDNSSDDEL